MSQGHLTFVCFSFAGAIALYLGWSRMKYPSTTPPLKTNVTLMAATMLLVIGIGAALDGWGYAWFGSQPPGAYAGLIVCLAVLVWLWELWHSKYAGGRKGEAPQ
jgi:predicted MFS family arabinose efflux permease